MQAAVTDRRHQPDRRRKQVRTATERRKQVERRRLQVFAADMIERVFLLITLGWFVWNLLPAVGHSLPNMVLLVSESATVLMLLVRTPGRLSMQPLAWAAALLGTFPPLLIEPNGNALIVDVVVGPLMLSGLIISGSAKITMNRAFGIVAANRGIKRRGPYRYVRHPMYLGYALTHAGFLLSHMSVWNVAVYVVTWTAILTRIVIEEKLLRQSPEYRDYAQVVRYRMFPGIY